VNWIQAESVTAGMVGVKPPTEPGVELFCAVDIRDWDHDRLEFHIDICVRMPAAFFGIHRCL
jgi:hypothetical protein